MSTPRLMCYTLGVLDPSKPLIVFFLAVVNKIKMILLGKFFPFLGTVLWDGP